MTLKLLESELPVTVRLMGIKLSSLKDCSVIPIEKFFVRKKSSKSDSKITLMDNSIDDADEQESIGEFGIGEHESNSQSEHKSDSKITPMDNSIDDVDERDAIRESGNKEHESDSQSSRNSVKKIRSEAITIDEMFKSPGIQNASYCQSIRCPICDKKLSTSSLENDSHFETCGQSKKKRTLFDVFESTLLSGAPKITKLDSVCPVCERELHVTNLQLNLHIDKCLKKRETFENFFTFSKKTSTP